MAEVTLEVASGGASHRWAAPVWFCEPWHPAFGLLGLTGFFDHFEVTVAADGLLRPLHIAAAYYSTWICTKLVVPGRPTANRR